MLVLVHENCEIDENEFLVCSKANQRRNLHGGFPYWEYDIFNLENLREDERQVEFRLK